MANSYFQFKEFRIEQEKSAMKVTTDGCLFGAWVASTFEDKTIGSVLDIGTGTGLLTLMLAQKIESKFDAVEIDENAAAEASQNFQNSKWAKRITLHHLSIQEFNPSYQFDVIVCNPPFFNQNLKGQSKSKNLAIHDDELKATDLANQIDRLLALQGTTYVMFPPREMESFQAIAMKMGIYLREKLLVKNLENQRPIRVLASFTRNVSEQIVRDLAIKKDANDYSDDFKHLLRQYYVYL